MGAKRRKLNPTVDKKAATAAPPMDADDSTGSATSTLLETIGASNLDLVLDELLTLKRRLTTKEQVLNFMETELRTFRAIISLVLSLGNQQVLRGKEALEKSEHQSTNPVLRETFSLLANTCHLSVLACVELNSKVGALNPLYAYFLTPPVNPSAPKSPMTVSLKTALLRLLGNLCELKETALSLALDQPLLCRVGLCLRMADEEAANQAMRILRLLAKRSQLAKSVLRADGCERIAEYIASRGASDGQQIFKRRPDILQTLNHLLKMHPSKVGLQLAKSSNFLVMCLHFVLKFPVKSPETAEPLKRHWLEFILHCTEYSLQMRSSFGREAVAKVLALEANKERLSDLHCRFLCAFTQETHSLGWLREYGGLDRLLERLWPVELNEKTDTERLAHMRVQGNILESLRHCLYQDALGHIIRHPNFMPVALHHIQRYLDQDGPKCQIEYLRPEEDAFVVGPRPPSSLMSAKVPEKNNENNNNEDKKGHTKPYGEEEMSSETSMDHLPEQPLCKDFAEAIHSQSLLPFSHSPSSSPPRCWSPSMSPSTSGVFSASPSAGCSSTSPGASPEQFPGSPTSSSPATAFAIDDYLLTEEGTRQPSISPPAVAAGAAPGELEPDDPDALVEIEATTPEQFNEEGSKEGEAGEEEDGEGAKEQQQTTAASRKERKLRQKIVHGSLRLITQFSHLEERLSIFLLRKEIMDTLIRHIGEAPELDNRLARALRRLARHQTGLQLLLEMDFQRMVINRLIRRPCTLARFARSCVRCDLRRDFGRQLLADHAVWADSQMGEHILLKVRMDAAAQLADPREAVFARLRAMMAALVFLRRDDRRPRFYHNFRPVDALLDVLSQLMRQSATEQQQDDIGGIRPLTEESEEGKLCCDIVATLGSLISHHHLDQLSTAQQQQQQHSQQKKMSEETAKKDGEKMEIGKEKDDEDDKCILEDNNNEHKKKKKTTTAEEQDDNDEHGEEEAMTSSWLNFRNERGKLLAKVPKGALCTGNEYFSGMFGSEFIERLESRNEFTFNTDAEACSEEDFIKFLHFSIGCPLSSKCVRVDSAESCSALLYLADKYLCTRLLDHLLGGGVAANFVTGQTLRLFLPLVLSVPTIADGGKLKDICMLVLLRHSNNPELLSTLRHIITCDCGHGATIDALMVLLREFVASNPQEGAPGVSNPQVLLQPHPQWWSQLQNPPPHRRNLYRDF